MKSPTNAYKALGEGLAKAKRIASRVPKMSPSTVEHELKVRALILLSHSTIEEYLEQLSREILDASIASFKASGEINVPLFSLISFHKSGFAENFSYPGNQTVFRDAVERAADEALAKHVNAIDNNHGIKASHCNALLFPLGLSISQVDATISATLEGFANKRGGVAHSIQIQTQYTRSDIETDIATIRALLKTLDEAACRAFLDKLHTI